MRRFGGLAAGYPMSYAVSDFFQNGGSTALVVRAYKPVDGQTDGYARLTVDKIKLKASSPGRWGNKLRAEIVLVTGQDARDALGLPANADLFNLTVRDTTPGGAIETIMNLAVLQDATRRVDKVVAAESSLVRWDGAWPAQDPVGVAAAKDPVTVKESVVATAAADYIQKKNVWVAAKNAVPFDQGAVDTAKTALDAAQAALTAAQTDAGNSESGLNGRDSLPLDQAAYLGDPDKKTGLQALVKADLFNLLCIPPDTDGGDTLPAVYQSAMQFCADHRAVLLVDSPAAWSANRDTAAQKAHDGLSDLNLSGLAARNAAIYFPRVREPDPMRDSRVETLVPCGIVAGIMARTDTDRGVWKAPAGLDAAINGIIALDAELNDKENGMLNPLGINCLRAFPIYGRVVWGARTLRGADQLADEYRYVPVRRLALYIEESLYRGTKWVVFEPNDEPLWAQIRLNVGAFMHNLFRQGAFQGTTPKDAYFVKCDKETTTQNDIDLGIVNIVVGFAPLKPAEFVIIRLQQMAGQIET
ncbi:MAG TPA: phage tail sheath C-terminal domain-containing protein [Gemmatimonadales bacterium]